ncbi:MAG: universal stress protein [Bacteroidales bacterium]|nr:universal stress protein [Bacteroidales bacterium]
MNTKIRRILVPIVFEDYSLNICKYAIALAEKINAEIKLFHVHKIRSKDEPFSGYSYQSTEGGGNIDSATKAKNEIEKICNNLREQISEKNIKNINVDYEFAEGIAVDKIADMCKEYNPHLVILGTKGEEKKTRALLGTATTNILEKIKNPVLAIPQDTIFHDFDNLNVLYATDFNDSDFSSFNKLLLLLSPFKVKIYCVHVETSNKLSDEKMETLRSVIKTKYSKYEIQCVLTHSENLFLGIQDFIEDNHIDMFSFTSPRKSAIQRLFKPDNLKKMFFYTNVPVLVFRA